ncbi:nephrin-like [Limulus polyphemus]|uniref:Nephrin-like n=1 Tax=Limulus polyphemus TaxID=6850 RepID=A0ABM1RZZ2_LIMPO|nr:nephrin-like [Limulus polyphemus]
MPAVTLLLLFASCLHGFTEAQQHFIVKPQDTEVVQGLTGILHCQVGNLQGAVQWSKDGFLLGFEAAIPGYKRYSMLVDVERGIYNLRVRDVKLEDEGEYQCQVGPAYNEGPIRAAARLIVLVPPDQLTINGRTTHKTIKVHKGERINLACSSQGSKPSVQLNWYRNNVQLLTESEDTVIRQEENKLYTTVSTILLYPTLDDNGAIYICEAVHPAMPLAWKTSVTISVLYPPETPVITGYTRKDVITKGDIVSLTCVSEGGNPPAQLRWFRFNTSLNGNYNYNNSMAASILTFTATASDNNVTYRCEASSSVVTKPLSASITISVQYPPEGVYVTGPPEARRGDVITVTCTTSPSNPAPNVRWRVNGRYIVGEEEYTTKTIDGWVTKSKITISLTRQDADSKTVVCRAGDEGIGYTNGSLQIKVSYPPDPPAILEYEEGNPILVGDIQRFNCISLGGNPPASLQWFRGERKISTQSRITGSGISSELMIKARREDNGAVYRCEASNSATVNPLIARIQLSVNFPPRNVTIHATPKYPRDGEKISLVCVTDSSQPPASITWWRNDQELQSEQEERLNAIYGGISTVSKLELVVTAEDDGSLFTCSAVNKVTRGIVRDVFLLSVIYKPVFLHLIKTIDIIENQTVVVNMSARGNPPPIQYTWIFREIKIPPASSRFNYEGRRRITAEGPFLKLQNASRLDSGIYYCKAENEEGSSNASVELNVLYPVSILNLTQNQMVKEGEKFMLECWIDGNPITHDTVMWRRRGVDTVLESRSSGSGRFLLEIDKITRTHSGEYECVAFNGIGQHDVEQVQLSVMYRPVFLESNMETKVAGEEGKSVVMRCEVDAMPDVTFDWYFKGRPISWVFPVWKYTTKTERNEDLNWINILHIYDVTLTDFDTYTCDVSNVLGKASVDIDLVKSSEPDRPFEIRTCNVTHISACVSWKPGFDGGYSQTYDVFWKKEDDRNYSIFHNINSSLYIFRNLKPKTKYLFKVVAKNHLGSSQPSEELILWTKPVPSVESTKVVNNQVYSKEALISRLVWTSIAVCGAVIFILIAFIVACCLRRRHQLRREAEAALRIYQLVQNEEYLKMFNNVDGQPFFVSGRTAEGVSREEGDAQDIQMAEREEFWKRRELNRPTRSGSCSSQLEAWGDEEIRRLKDGVPLEERYDCPDLLKKGSMPNKENCSKKPLLHEEDISTILSYVGGPVISSPLLHEEDISTILSYVGGPVISSLDGGSAKDESLRTARNTSEDTEIAKLSDQHEPFLDHRMEYSREIVIP